MTSKALDKDEVMKVLCDGGTLWQFRDGNGVAIHDEDGNPIQGCYCPNEIFLAIRKEGVIFLKEKNKAGYPFYANNYRSDVYLLKQE